MDWHCQREKSSKSWKDILTRHLLVNAFLNSANVILTLKTNVSAVMRREWKILYELVGLFSPGLHALDRLSTFRDTFRILELFYYCLYHRHPRCISAIYAKISRVVFTRFLALFAKRDECERKFAESAHADVTKRFVPALSIKICSKANSLAANVFTPIIFATRLQTRVSLSDTSWLSQRR